MCEMLPQQRPSPYNRAPGSCNVMYTGCITANPDYKCLRRLFTRTMQMSGLEAPNCSHMDEDAVDPVMVDVRDAAAAEAKLSHTEQRSHVM